ncbi:MAG: hypothetical protein H0U89_11400 [Acidimicrobiia bacterium]|nr:hypothetical protein [Acidimicrobiia bacterium]
MARRRTPRLVVVSGLPGAGKSTISEHLGQRLPAAVFAKDVARPHCGDVVSGGSRAPSGCPTSC